MIISFNLLPPHEKKELQIAKFNQQIYYLIGYLSVLGVVFTLLLASTYFYLSILLKEQAGLIEVAKNDARTQRWENIEKEIEASNELINDIYLKQKSFFVLTPVLEEISKIVPSGVRLNNLTYQGENSRLSLSGHADWRANILNFQNIIRENKMFSDLNSPLINLLKARNIDFNFDFKVIVPEEAE